MQQGLIAGKEQTVGIHLVAELRKGGNIEGLDSAPDLLIYIDRVKASRDGIIFHSEGNKENTIVTEGVSGNLHPKYFRKVIDRESGRVLYQSPDDPEIARFNADTVEEEYPDDVVIHGTYFENLPGIFNQGLLPAGSPIGPRLPHRDHDTHHHVHASPLPDRYQPIPGLGPTPIRGLERPADVCIVVDVRKAVQEGVTMYPHAGDPRTLLFHGHVPRSCIKEFIANEPADLPDSLRAKIHSPFDFDTVPIVDLSPSRSHEDVAEEFGRACREVGFLQITGHGVAQDMLDRCLDFARKLFKLPTAAKLALHQSHTGGARGYFGRGDENLDIVDGRKARKTDNKEGFDCSNPAHQPEIAKISKSFGCPNRWPEADAVPGFVEFVQEYHDEMSALGRRTR